MTVTLNPVQAQGAAVVAINAPNRPVAEAVPEKSGNQPQPPQGFFSPSIEYDPAANRVILQFRDGDTGEVVRQYPTEAELDTYRKQQSVGAPVEDKAVAPAAAQAEPQEEAVAQPAVTPPAVTQTATREAAAKPVTALGADQTA